VIRYVSTIALAICTSNKIKNGRIYDLQKIVSWNLFQLFKRLFIVILAWGWGFLFVLHDLISEGLARILQEFSSLTLIVVTPVLKLTVLGPRNKT